MTSLRNKIAIVTGASRSRGIGTAICRSLASQGADIFFTHWHAFDETEGNGGDKEWPEQLSMELENLGVMASHMEADLANPETPALIMDQVEKTLGQASILINNATYCVSTNFRNLNIQSLELYSWFPNDQTQITWLTLPRRAL